MTPFPFAAIVGQDEMKTAMILTAIDPKIGGVLVFGDRGTGKSTAVRALAALLPPIEAVKGCPVNSARLEDCPDWAQVTETETTSRPTPVVDLPLGVTEDRVTGALDIERALTRGEKAFEAGLLARANRGYLYIDEVNLLEDHIVDLLLDVAQSGENVVEREGMSIRHAARFVLVGSGNPEEGELRPQLLDRFGLSVEVTSPKEIDTRVEVIRRRDAYENDYDNFMAEWQPQDVALRARILDARAALAGVRSSNVALHDCASVCVALGSDGLRGELTLLRTARALAAFEGADEVTRAHIREAAPMALRHRLRRDPLDEAGTGARVARQLAEVLP
ncbi:magnesium chelatase ATPase subunit I [Roseinatronobacter bogoriensis]|uniref:Mg-protoporphyrin IX chelatase n=1 Tax=Roseinatronobacter bogoriensis subsp. barguzinensis TaxID=441209 RepID=A0A2K8K649_9RHOB|nr:MULTISPECIES: magnesium chelatase ATPase subunit I [Rhodobaca]ATX64927.1 magnesium chelatase ATPase subunit I [Rhodobaca barguzinensis]MBB4208739.1 magnesium chelatase subunit I [Rhodobaca bogoriensis DSM 18756]TDW37993.1 protoporphyrin IX magnesium-chelatase [Rhodobaca barguzinensis]TDY69837.1 protoporphyrin IX magnesium-chelatase [Rhodobaca bogoriensis DSM 18756]